MQVSEDFVFNILCDLRKKDLNPIERAKFILNYIDEKKISQRQLAKELNVPHSTLQDWISYGKITQQDYDVLKVKGYKSKQIYRIVRDDRKNVLEHIEKAKHTPKINMLLEDFKVELNPFIHNVEYDNETIELLKELRNVINRIELHIEQKR